MFMFNSNLTQTLACRVSAFIPTIMSAFEMHLISHFKHFMFGGRMQMQILRAHVQMQIHRGINIFILMRI